MTLLCVDIAQKRLSPINAISDDIKKEVRRVHMLIYEMPTPLGRVSALSVATFDEA